jgi:hypothetical protein
MKLTEPRVNWFVSDEGFSVEFLGRSGIEYKEARRKLRSKEYTEVTQSLVFSLTESANKVS